MINITQTEKAKVYVTGSALFFSCYEDFIPHDLDLTTILSKNDIRLHGQLLLRIILFDNVELFA